MSQSLHQRWAALEKNLQTHGRVLVAFSGGCDSAFLLAAACRVLGTENVLGVTAVSASLPSREKADTVRLSERIGATHQFIHTKEFENDSYISNPSNRCYFCKDELFSMLAPIAAAGSYVIVDGYNASDRSDNRPGLRAAHERAIRHPLNECDLPKKDLRVLSRWMRLPTWNKPASPCLSSRVPHGTPVTLEVLRQIDRAEIILRDEGFPVVRVRHYENEARIELPLKDIFRLETHPKRVDIYNQIRAVGYNQITLDPQGFRSGRWQEAKALETETKEEYSTKKL